MLKRKTTTNNPSVAIMPVIVSLFRNEFNKWARMSYNTNISLNLRFGVLSRIVDVVMGVVTAALHIFFTQGKTVGHKSVVGLNCNWRLFMFTRRISSRDQNLLSRPQGTQTLNFCELYLLFNHMRFLAAD